MAETKESVCDSELARRSIIYNLLRRHNIDAFKF